MRPFARRSSPISATSQCKEDLQTQAVGELFRRAWQKEQQAAGFCDDEHPDTIGGIGEELVRIYMRRASPPIQPAAIEQRTMRGVLASVRIQAQIDILDEDGMIIAINTPDQHHHLVDVFAESLRLRPRGFQLLSDSGIIAAPPVTLRARRFTPPRVAERAGLGPQRERWEGMTIRRKTIGVLPTVPSNQETVTICIPAGQEIEVLEGGRAPLGYVLIRWKAYSEPLRGLFVLENNIRDLTEE